MASVSIGAIFNFLNVVLKHKGVAMKTSHRAISTVREARKAIRSGYDKPIPKKGIKTGFKIDKPPDEMTTIEVHITQVAYLISV